ncbi:hypothetical protein Misp06_03319 [Microbulbifer sp. NBRC 101763]
MTLRIKAVLSDRGVLLQFSKCAWTSCKGVLGFLCMSPARDEAKLIAVNSCCPGGKWGKKIAAQKKLAARLLGGSIVSYYQIARLLSGGGYIRSSLYPSSLSSSTMLPPPTRCPAPTITNRDEWFGAFKLIRFAIFSLRLKNSVS